MVHVDDGVIRDTVGVAPAGDPGGGREAIRVVEGKHASTLEIDVGDVGESAVGSVEGQAPLGPAFAQPVGGIVYAIDSVSVAFPGRRAAADTEHVDVSGESIVGGEAHISLPLLRESSRP